MMSGKLPENGSPNSLMKKGNKILKYGKYAGGAFMGASVAYGAAFALGAVYKVFDPDIVDNLKTPKLDQNGTGNSPPLSVGIGVFIATMLRPLGDIFALPNNTLINSVILSVLAISVIIMVVTINNRCKKKLQQVVELEKSPRDKLWIRPQSIKNFAQLLVTYPLLLAVTLLLFYFSIVDYDVITLLFTVISMGFVYFTHVLTAAVGETNVKFKGSKKQSANAE